MNHSADIFSRVWKQHVNTLVELLFTRQMKVTNTERTTTLRRGLTFPKSTRSIVAWRLFSGFTGTERNAQHSCCMIRKQALGPSLQVQLCQQQPWFQVVYKADLLQYGYPTRELSSAWKVNFEYTAFWKRSCRWLFISKKEVSELRKKLERNSKVFEQSFC